MVFVTLGNATQGFRRLLDAIDTLAGNGFFGGDQVFIQSGNNCDFHPLHCQYKAFLSTDEFDESMNKAKLVICHGGCTQLQAIRLRKVPVVMPRRKKYGEHVNDHQLQLVQALASEGSIVPAYEPEDLPGAIAEARRRNTQPAPFSPSRMSFLVSQAIEDLMGKK